MKTDVIRIAGTGEGTDAALQQTEKAAAYRGLTKKETLRLRLLAEELFGMLRTIVGERDARYWIEAEGKAFALHLSMKTRVDADLREALLDASTTGRNEAAKGFMGRLRDILLQMEEQDDIGATMLRMDYGLSAMDTGSFEAPMGVTMHGLMVNWTLSDYRTAVQRQKETDAAPWDELEKSITAKLADEIKIFIRDGVVEMVIEKAF